MTPGGPGEMRAATASRLMLAGLLCGFLGRDFPVGSEEIAAGFSRLGLLSWQAPVQAPAALPREVAKPSIFVINPADPVVRQYIDLYTKRKHSVMQEALDRMELYRPMVAERLKAEGLPEELMYLPLVESEYSAAAVSPVGAVGLWQFMESTGRAYGLKINYWQDERRDPVKATAAAARHLKDLHQWFDDWQLALAAYNRGLGGISRDLKRTRAADYAVVSRRNGLPPETREYVPNLMACILIARDPEAYGFKVNKPSFPESEEVLLDKPLDLKIAARCAGTSEGALRELNPGLRLWCTPKSGGPTLLRVPAGAKERFLHLIARVKDWTPPHEELLAKS